MRAGTAGWSIHSRYTDLFCNEGSHLQRYASRLDSVEINSCFYRRHKPATYERWAASVPKGFLFAVKLFRGITHERRLQASDEVFQTFLEDVQHLGDKLGPILVQLPPSLAFDKSVADRFFDAVRCRYEGDVVCEPRHGSWFTIESEQTFVDWRIPRVAADPALPGMNAMPGGWNAYRYYRLHGSPAIYRSSYSNADIEAYRNALRLPAASGHANWCVFDNTADGEALANAVTLVSSTK